MRESLKTALSGAASALLLTTLLFGRAALTDVEAARFRQYEGQSPEAARVSRLPSPVSFRESGRGLIVRAWVNGAGPFDFALDTGAGATILSSRAAGAARV